MSGARFTLDQISKMPPAIQAQVYGKPVSPPSVVAESPPELKEPPPLPVLAVAPPIDSLPVYIPEELLRYLLDSFAGPFYVAQTETQRRKVVSHAVKTLASRESNPNRLQ